MENNENFEMQNSDEGDKDVNDGVKGSNKSTLFITIIILLVIGVIVFITVRSWNKDDVEVEEVPKVLTDQEKMEIMRSLPASSRVNGVNSLSKDNKEDILDSLQDGNVESNETPLSEGDKLKIMESFYE